MKHRLYNQRSEYIKEIYRRRGNMIEIDGSRFLNLIRTSQDDLCFHLFQQETKNDWFSIGFNYEKPYIMYVIQISYTSQIHLQKMVRRMESICKEGKFKEIEARYITQTPTILRNDRRLSLEEAMEDIEKLGLYNPRVEGDSIKWEVDEEEKII